MSFWERAKSFVIPTTHNAYRPHLLGRGWLVAFLALSLAAEGFLVANLVSRQSTSNFLAAVISSDLVTLTNTERQQHTLQTLTESPLLRAAAQRKAEDMAAQGYFSHVGPDGKVPWAWLQEAGYDYRYAGENLAVRFVDSADVVRAWMKSPSHRANIVKDKYTHIGIGVANGTYNGTPTTFVVQFFGTPRGDQAAVALSEPASFMQSLSNQFARFAANPQSSTAWLLMSVAILISVLLVLGVFVKIHVQTTQRLLPGAVVAVIALTLLAINGSILTGGSEAQTASVGAIPTTGQVEIGDFAASVSR